MKKTMNSPKLDIIMKERMRESGDQNAVAAVLPEELKKVAGGALFEECPYCYGPLTYGREREYMYGYWECWVECFNCGYFDTWYE